jgi:hypothetical protein
MIKAYMKILGVDKVHRTKVSFKTLGWELNG